MNETTFNENASYYTGKVVPQTDPFMKGGKYWGYQVRVAHSISEVFDNCPYEGGYDLKIGDSYDGDFIDFIDFKKHQDFKHSLIFFGGIQGIDGIIEEFNENDNLKVSEVRKLFDVYVNSCPERGCRQSSLRTEESMLISMGALMPKMRCVGSKQEVTKIKQKKSFVGK